MTRFLLDSHLPNTLAEGLRRHGVDAVELSKWKGGAYRSAPDAIILSVADEERRVLVTFDCRSIPALLRELAETGQHHAGVVLISSLSFRPDNIGALLRALCSLASSNSDDWEDRVVFLTSRFDPPR